MSQLIITFSILVILIALNALYVLSEFSSVSSRRARLTSQAELGNLRAAQILAIVENPRKLDAYVATSQVGITISSLVLGFFGQARLSGYLAPLLERYGQLGEAAALSISTSLILLVLTTIQVLFGELIPKNLGIQKPEMFAALTYRPLKWSGWIFGPLIWLFNGSGILLMRVFGIEPSAEHGHIHSPEEIAILIEESGQGGVISAGEYHLLTNTMRMRASLIKHIMIPRANMLAAPDTLSLSELNSLVTNSPYSRVPIYSESIDNIVGIVHLRDLICLSRNFTDPDTATLTGIIRPVQYVPENVQVKEVFTLLQKGRYQVAIILDEYGGTAGMATLEDLIEEIFGDLQDEFDPLLPAIQLLSEDRLLIQGSTPIIDIERILGITLPSQEMETIGGLLTEKLGRFPEQNETVMVNGHNFSVHSLQRRAVGTVILTAPPMIIQNFKAAR
jgi:CBS domain containing-hemolysin-like protein